jgi:hypothetical protein
VFCRGLIDKRTFRSSDFSLEHTPSAMWCVGCLHKKKK